MKADSTMRNRRFVAVARIAITCLATCAITVFLAGCQGGPQENAANTQGQASSSSRGAAVGQAAPDALLTYIDGSQERISDLAGNPTILSFWGTWCPYCIKEMPDLQKIKENYPEVNVVLVNCGEDKDTVTKFAEQEGYDFLWALDEQYEVQAAYPTRGIPYTVVIDSEGVVTEIFEGSGPDMYSKFEAALKKAQA